jgi:hypothetical protein
LSRPLPRVKGGVKLDHRGGGKLGQLGLAGFRLAGIARGGWSGGLRRP